MERREGVVGNLGPRLRHRCKERRFTGVRQADQPGVCDQFEAQPDGHFQAGQSCVGVVGGLIGCGLEAHVAKAAVAALGQHHTVADVDEIGQQRFAVFGVDFGTGRNFDGAIRATSAGAVLAHAVFAVLGLVVLLIAVIDQRVEVVDAFDVDIAALAAVAAERSAELDVFFAAECDAAVPAVTGADVDFGLVEEFHCICLSGETTRSLGGVFVWPAGAAIHW